MGKSPMSVLPQAGSIPPPLVISSSSRTRSLESNRLLAFFDLQSNWQPTGSQISDMQTDTRKSPRWPQIEIGTVQERRSAAMDKESDRYSFK